MVIIRNFNLISVHSWTHVSRLVDAFADILELEATPVEGQQLQKKS